MNRWRGAQVVFHFKCVEKGANLATILGKITTRVRDVVALIMNTMNTPTVTSLILLLPH